jgi:chromosome segregation ATPase
MTEGEFMKMRQHTLLMISLLFAASLVRAGDVTPEEGLKKLSENIETSGKNRDEYQKAIVQIGQNINTLESATVNLQTQKQKLVKQMNDNKNTLGLHTKKLQELDRSRADEEKKKTDEVNKIAQMEKTLVELKGLQKTRQDRIDKLGQDRLAIEKSQKEGEVLQLTLAGEAKELDQRIDSLKKEAAPWKTKKKGYEKEATKWSNELDRHQKMETEVKLLLDSTT